MENLERPTLEQALSMPLGSVLPLIQKRIMTNTTWMGVPALKSPNDAWVYQEMIHSLKPTTIIEIGIYHGGSTLYLANLCDLLGIGKILAVELSLDRVDQRVLDHPRIEVFGGRALDVVSAVEEQIDNSGHVLVIEDSSHSYEHTLAVCHAYGRFVTPDSYLIVEDTICHHGLDVGPNPGPYEAAAEFVRTNPDFVVRPEKEDFVVTWNPSGYLQRLPSSGS